MSSIFAAPTAESIKNIALGVSIASVVVGLILMKVVSSVVGKIISLVIFAAIALGGFTQRASITDCVNKVKAGEQAAVGDSFNVKCTFFGQDVTLKVPAVSK